MENNPQLKNGYTRIANDLLEKFSQTSLSGSSWRVLMAIIRKIYGFNKKEDWISYKQLSEMTGLSKPKISQCVKQLSETGTVRVTRNGNKIIIGLLKNYKVLPERVRLTRKADNRYQKRELTVTRKTHLTGSTKDNVTKETIQKKRRLPKEDELSLEDFNKIAKRYNVPLDFVKVMWDRLYNYCHASNNGYIKFTNALSNWVSREKEKLGKESYDKKSAIDARAIIAQKSQARV